MLGVGYKRQIASYDYSKNKFEYDNIKPEHAYQYMNERFSEDEDLYGRYRNAFLNSGALMVKTIGNITRLPGSIVGISIDRGQAELMEESPQMYEDILRRYKGLEGAWIVAKTHHYI